MPDKDQENLILAARINDDETTALLLERGVPPDCTNHRNRTPLIEAASRGFVEVTKVLLTANAATEIKDDTGEWTALHHAASENHPAVVNLLIQANASVNAQDNVKDTPLHEAVRYAHIGVIRLLLDARASVNQTNNIKVSPLTLAAKEGNVAVCELLSAAAELQAAAALIVEAEAADKLTAVAATLSAASTEAALADAFAANALMHGILAAGDALPPETNSIEQAAVIVGSFLKLGTQVQLFGLVGAAALNGETGAIIGEVHANGRYPVRVQGRSILLKSSNLQRLAAE